jgi:hypothetical protein
VGTEQPFAGRLRLAAVLQHSSYADEDARVLEQRLLLGASVAVDDVAMLAAAMPLVWREVDSPDLSHDSAISPGDLDLRLRITLFRERPFAPAHRLVLELGTRAPTAPLLTHGGRSAVLAAQPGTGAFEPLVGLSWSSRIDDTTLWASAQGAFPTTGHRGWRNGPALRGSLAAQWQPLRELALRAISDLRLEGPSGLGAQLDGGPSLVVFLGGGVVVAPTSSLVLHLVARFPVLQLQDPSHAQRSDGVAIEAGVAIDV